MNTSLPITLALVTATHVLAQSIWLVSTDGERIGPIYVKQGSQAILGNTPYTVIVCRGDVTSINQKLDRIVIPDIDLKNESAPDIAKKLFSLSYEFDPSAEGIPIVFDSGITPQDLPLITVTGHRIKLKAIILSFAKQCGLLARIDKNCIVLTKQEEGTITPDPPPVPPHAAIE